MGNFLEVRWLGLRASTAGVQCRPKKKKEKGNIEMLKNMNNYPNY